MDEIDSLLGVDPADELDELASELVEADFVWVDQLVRMRKQLGLSQAQVAKLMGRSQSVVSDIETMSSDPRLSTLRRYALAIGVAVKHRVLRRAAPHPLIKAERDEPVVVRSACAGSVRAATASHRVFFLSATGHHLEVVST